MTLFVAWAQRLRKSTIPQPPGNSLPLIDQAYQLGYDGVELDLQMSKDGVLMLMHDGTLDATTHAQGPVAAMTRDELCAVQLKDTYGYGTPCFVPTFEQALRVNGRRGPVMVDIRRVDARHLDALHAATRAADFDPAMFLFLAYDREKGLDLKREFPRSVVMLKAPANLKPPALTVDFVDKAEGLDAVIVPTASSLEVTAEFQRVTARRGLKLGVYLFHQGLDHLLGLMDLGVFSVTALNPDPFAEARIRHADTAAADPGTTSQPAPSDRPAAPIVPSRDFQAQISTVTKEDRYPSIFLGVAEANRESNVSRVLSFGCSTGEEPLALATKYFPSAQVVGVDVSPEALAAARARTAGEPRITILPSTPETILEHGPFDVIFAMSVLCVWPQSQGRQNIADLYPYERFCEHVSVLDRALRPGGFLVLYNTNYEFLETSIARNYDVVLISNGSGCGFVTRFNPDGSAFCPPNAPPLSTYTYRKRTEADRPTSGVRVLDGRLRRVLDMPWPRVAPAPARAG